MEEHSFVEAFLGDTPGAPSFDMLMNAHFMEQVHLSAVDPMYMVHFLMGFSLMLLSPDTRIKYGIQHVAFAYYPEYNIVKVIVLTNGPKPGMSNAPVNVQQVMEKKIYVRTFFLSPPKTIVPRLLTVIETEAIEDLLSDHIDGTVKDWACKILYDKGLLDDEIIRSFVTDDVHEFFNKCEQQDPQVAHEARDMLNKKRQESKLIFYKTYFKEYVIEQMKIYKDEVMSRQRTKLIMTEIFNQNKVNNYLQKSIKITFEGLYATEMSLRQWDLSKNEQQVDEDMFHYLSQLDGFELNVGETRNVIFVMNNERFAGFSRRSRNTIDTAHEHFLNMFNEFKLNPINFNKGKYVEFITSLKNPYKETLSFLDPSLQKPSLAKECAFVQGALLSLKHIHWPLEVAVFQYVPRTFDLTRHDMLDLERVNDFCIVMQFRSPNPLNNAMKALVLITFNKQYTNAAGDFKPRSMSGFLCIAQALKENGPVGTWKMLKRYYIMESISNVFQNDHQSLAVKSMDAALNICLRHIKSTAKEHPILETNYLSRYFLGLFLAAPQLETQGYEAFIAVDKNTQGRMVFVIENSQVQQFRKLPMQSKLTKIAFVFDEQPMPLKHFLEPHPSDEDEHFQDVQNPQHDTVVFYIKQTYANTRSDFEEEEYDHDFINVEKNIKYTKFSDIGKTHQKTSIPSFPIDLTMDKLVDGHTERFKGLLGSYVQQFSNYVNYPEDFKALLDGIFWKYNPANAALALRQSLSTVQYSFVQTAIIKPDIESELNIQEESKKLITLNFKMSYDKLNEKDAAEIAHNSVLAAIRNENSHEENTVSEFVSFVLSNEEKYSIQSASKAAVLEECSLQGLRVKRSRKKCIPFEKEERKNDNLDAIEIEKLPKTSVRLLRDLETVGNFMMIGFMLRDAVADATHGHKLACAKDVGFLLATLFSPKLSKLATQYGGKLLLDEAKVAGYSFNAIGFGVNKAISAYVLYDFVTNVVAYTKNTNDSNALIGMSIDGAFLAIDAINLAIEGMETFGLISGVAATTGPLGAIIGAVLILGLNVYQTVKKVEQINTVIRLTDDETVKESIRAFLHLDPESSIQTLIDEKAANDYILAKSIEALKSQNNIDTYITKSGRVIDGKVKVNKDSIIDMRLTQKIKVSRAAPKPNPAPDLKISCYLHQEKFEVENTGFWSNVEHFIAKSAKSVKVLIDYFRHDSKALMHDVVDDYDGSMIINGYICHNSFGVKSTVINSSKAALFNLNDGNDYVFGYTEKPNIFKIGSGVKNVTGGNKDDLFILSTLNIIGILNGGSGINQVDLMAVESSKVITYNKKCIGSENEINKLKIINIQHLTGREKKVEHIICDCALRTVRTLGGQPHGEADTVTIPYDNCYYNLTVYLEGNTFVKNEANFGDFTYILQGDPKSPANVTLHFTSPGSKRNNNILIRANLGEIESLAIDNNITDHISIFIVTPAAKLKLWMLREKEHPGAIKLHFNDGPILTYGLNVLTLTLNTEKSVESIAKTYVDIVNRLNIPMVAYSTTDQESVTFTHGDVKIHNMAHENSSRLLHIVHNPVDHASHLLLNGGEYLILVKAQATVGNGRTNLDIPNFILIPNGTKETKLTIDLHPLHEQLHSETSLDVQGGFAEDNDLRIQISVTRQNKDAKVLIGTIIIVDALTKNFFRNVTVSSYGDFVLDGNCLQEMTDEFQKLERSQNIRLNGCLKLIPLEFGENIHFIILSSDNVEWYHMIYVNMTIGNYDFYRADQSLVITNAPYNALWDYMNMCTIIIENFYTVDKLQTLRFRTRYKTIDLKVEANAILQAGNFSEIWDTLRTNKDIYDSFNHYSFN